MLQLTVVPVGTKMGSVPVGPPPRGRVVSRRAMREWDVTGVYKRSAIAFGLLENPER